MKPQRHKTAVGAFVLGAVTLFAVGLILLTTRRFFSDDVEYILYFDDAVNGLSIGAPVLFRGVPLGSVTKIHLVADARKSDVTIPVFISLNHRNIMQSDDNSEVSEKFEQQIIRDMVDRGLRAKLRLQSLITGKYVVELDFYPETKQHYRSTSPEIEIPTIPSPIDAFQRALSKMPLEHLLQTLDDVLVNLNHALADGKLKEGLAAFAGTFVETEKLLKNQEVREAGMTAMNRLNEISRLIYEQTPSSIFAFREVLRSVSEAASQVRQAADSVEHTAGRDSPAVADLRRLLQEGAAAARALRTLADMLERNPESLLKGRGGIR